MKEAKRLKAAAATGQLRDVQQAVEGVDRLAAAAASMASELRSSWRFDVSGYLETGEYTKELLAAAAATGVRAVESDQRILCYPSIVQVSPADATVIIDKKKERRIRPSVLVGHLADLQARPPKFKPEAFLESLAAAYGMVANRPGAVAKLTSVYSVLTLLPGARPRLHETRVRPRPVPPRPERRDRHQGRADDEPARQCPHAQLGRADDGHEVRPREGVCGHRLPRAHQAMIAVDDYATFLETEYLHGYVDAGGAAVKFVVPATDGDAARLSTSIGERAEAAGFAVARVDAATTKVHLLEQVLFAVSRQIDWDVLADSTARRALGAAGYPVAEGGELAVDSVAGAQGIDPRELKRDLDRQLQLLVYRDYAMVQEFRIAMLRLCQARLRTGQVTEAEHAAVLDWLSGDLRQISLLKSALIFRRIARHNARHVLFSLAHWLAVNGRAGLVLELDIRRLGQARRPPAEERVGHYYTKAAVLDAYEVLRQLVDNTDELTHFCAVVVAAPEFLTDPLPRHRRLPGVEAAHLRRDPRPPPRQSVLVARPARCSVTAWLPPVPADVRVQRRRAIEALRAGVPNRDAVMVLGSLQVGVEDRFSQLLDAVERGRRDRHQAGS